MTGSRKVRVPAKHRLLYEEARRAQERLNEQSITRPLFDIMLELGQPVTNKKKPPRWSI